MKIMVACRESFSRQTFSLEELGQRGTEFIV